MKKAFFKIIVIGTLYLCSCNNLYIKNSRMELNIKGKVKEITTNYYRAILKKSCRDNIRPLELKLANSEVLDSKNYMALLKAIKNISKSDIEKDTLVGKEVSKFDPNGNRTEKKEYNSHGKVQSIFEYTYNDAKQIIEVKANKKDGSMYVKYEYTYTSNEQVQDSYSPEREFELKTISKFDPNGNKIEEKICKNLKDLPLSTNTLIYDNLGNLIERISHNTGGIVTGNVFIKYDEKGDLLKSCTSKEDLDNDGKEWLDWNPSMGSPKPPKPLRLYTEPAYTYLNFDSQDNWLKSIYFENFDDYAPTYIFEREIKYY